MESALTADALRQQFLDAMSRAACTVSIVTTDGPGGKAGVTVSAMAAVSADAPNPSVLICVHHQSPVCQAIRENLTYCINMLRDDQAQISDVFAGRLPAPDGDKFGCAEWRVGETGVPVLAEPLVALECKLVHDVRWRSHHIFVGEIVAINLHQGMSPLVYANRSYGTAVPII